MSKDEALMLLDEMVRDGLLSKDTYVSVAAEVRAAHDAHPFPPLRRECR